MCLDRKDIQSMIKDSETNTHEYINASHQGIAKTVSNFGDTIIRLDDEQKSLKKYLIGILISVMFGLIGYGVWMGNIQTRIAHNEADIQSIIDSTLLLTASQSTIQIQLARIETLLMEIQKGIDK